MSQTNSGAVAASPLEDYFAEAEDSLWSHGWVRRALEGGDVLYELDEPANRLAWVVSGELIAKQERAELADLARELVGEAGAFVRGGTRTATVQAASPTILWELPGHRLRDLRRDAPAVYGAILTGALDVVAERIERLDEEIARRAGWFFDSFDAQTGSCDVPLAAPADGRVDPRLDAFDGLPVSLDDVARNDLAANTRLRRVRKGEALCRQGEAGERVWIVDDGALVVLRAKADGEAVELAVVEGGAMLGTAALFADEVRSASLVAREDTVVVELTREGLEALSESTRIVLSESFLIILSGQLARANIAVLRSRGGRGSITMEDTIRGLAGLQSWRADGPVAEVSLRSLPVPELVVAPDADRAELFKLIRMSIIGADLALPTAFGVKRVVYADYTASGRCLGFVEDYIRDQVMPLYANTHSEASASGLQTTHYREEARQIIARSVGADLDEYAVIFAGSGATGAINKLVDILGLRIPVDLDARYDLASKIPPEERAVVFFGAYEHHSNILPWRHSLADAIMIPLDEHGHIDTGLLEELLVEYQDRPLRIGSFSAASNVTGILTDTHAIASLLHEHGALSFWDYAGAGPYVDIDVRPSGDGVDPELAYKDAVFISPHKFIGGPGSPGVLVVKRELVDNTVPTQPGGGTVDFVTQAQASYIAQAEAREEAGTPAIIESIRAGLAFQLKDRVGAEAIEHMEQGYARQAVRVWGANPTIDIVGNPDAERLSITSFMIRHGSGFLHYGFVVSLLNDLFGVQARGGCSCAGPYAGVLLGLSPNSGDMFLERAEQGWMSLKPGWSRVNFNYFISNDEFQYILGAVQLVAIYGWALIPHYDFNPRSGLWTHREGSPYEAGRLSDLILEGGTARWDRHAESLPESVLEDQLAEGRHVLERALVEPPPETQPLDVPDEFEDMRWFPLPHEVAEHLRERQSRHPETRQEPADVRLQTYARALNTGDPATAESVRVGLRITADEHASVVTPVPEQDPEAR